LNKTKITLDQYGVQADAVLNFTRIHKYIKLELPDRQFLKLKCDFSSNLFYTVKNICKELSIRYPEELSLLLSSSSTSKNNLHNNGKNEKENDRKKANKLEKQMLKNENDSVSSNSTLNNSDSPYSDSTILGLNSESKLLTNNLTKKSTNKFLKNYSNLGFDLSMNVSMDKFREEYTLNDLNLKMFTFSPVIPINEILDKKFSNKPKTMHKKCLINKR
jgi:hypothetical protein